MSTSLVVYTTVHPWIASVVDEVRPEGFDVEFLDLGSADEPTIESTLNRADFIVCLKLSTAQCEMLGRCKLVMLNGVGYDGVDVVKLRELGIPVAVTPAMTPEGVAEHALLLMLAVSKQLPAVRSSMEAGEWNMFGWRQGSHNLAGKRVGIVGVGHVGSHVAAILGAFGCNIQYCDIVEVDPALVALHEMTSVSFDELIETSDIITTHTPLTPQTTKMYTAETFARMQPGAIFINTSRGETYDLEALVEAVTSGHLRGAGLDVFDPEPLPADHPVRSITNIVCTPHVSSGTVERQYAINAAQFANCQRILDGSSPQHLVSQER